MVNHLLEYALVLVDIKEHFLRMSLNQRAEQIAPVAEKYRVE